MRNFFTPFTLSILLFVSFLTPTKTYAQYTQITDFISNDSITGANPVGDLINVGDTLYGLTKYGGANNKGTLFKILPDGTAHTILFNFTVLADGSNPSGSLIYDGTFLYGTTETGGTYNGGTIFKILLDGSGFSSLLSFSGYASGMYPRGSLLLDGGFLYGLTSLGGSNSKGTIYKIGTNGTGFVKLLDFNGTTKGSTPYGSLIIDSNFLYGTTSVGGIHNKGTIFKIGTNGTGFTKLKDFDSTTTGLNPVGSLIIDSNFLYGTTRLGGINNKGTIFKIKTNGTEYTKLLEFDGTTNGSSPYGSLISDGSFLYGMTREGGTNYSGVAFKIRFDGTGYAKLLNFETFAKGNRPIGSLIFMDSFLFGMTQYGGVNNDGTLFKVKMDGTNYAKLFDFAGPKNGSTPRSPLTKAGNFLYGTTFSGGLNNSGTIYKISTQMPGYTKILDFAAYTGAGFPIGALCADSTFLYGATYGGGTNNIGTIFKIRHDGTGYTTLVNFEGAANGSYPYGYLIIVDSFLYGMTYTGGISDGGTIFKVKKDGTGFAKLLNFTGASNGKNPIGGLVYNGTFLYGMTYYGGATDDGTLFKILPDGTGFAKLVDFGGMVDGRNPEGSLIMDSTFLYGITNYGGLFNRGTLFKIKADGTQLANLYNFGGVASGSIPVGSLLDYNGSFYGATSYGGVYDKGMLYKINSNGAGYTKLYDFKGANNGSNPVGSLINDSAFLYGTTYGGGAANIGTVFKFKECAPSSGIDVQYACKSYKWMDSITYTASNDIAKWTLTNMIGCDSVVTLKLTIDDHIASTDVQTACISYKWMDSITYTSSNDTAKWILKTAAGCDSLVTLNLTINHPTTAIDVQTACGAYKWMDSIIYTSSNNTAQWILTNAAGCDSVITLNLTIRQPTYSVDVQTACGSYKWIDSIIYTSSNDTAKWKLTNAAGCDSTITLNLTIKQPTTAIDNHTACGSYNWMDSITYTSSNNTAKWILNNAAGCDSTITLNLTINTVDVGVTKNKSTITANNATATAYQWLNCDNDYAIITAENAQSFTAKVNGNYAVEIKENGCTDTSACVAITNVGIQDLVVNSSVSIFPNPSANFITIKTNDVYLNKTYSIFNALGQQVLSGKLANETTILDISSLTKGFYFMQIGEEEKQIFKLMKK